MDTTLDGTQIFARNIRVVAQLPTGQSSGQIVDYRPGSGELIVRDTISPEPVKMRLAGNAVILQGDRIAGPAELKAGTLVTLAFTPGNGEAPIVRQISILALPARSVLPAQSTDQLVAGDCAPYMRNDSCACAGMKLTTPLIARCATAMRVSPST